MPNRDGTGPNGQGALTGRGMGDCVDKENVNSQRDCFWRWRPCGWNRAGARMRGWMGCWWNRSGGRGMAKNI